jgi:hypothetical protein
VPWGLAKSIEWIVNHQAATDQPGSRRIDKAKRAAIAAGGLQSDFQDAEDRNLLERFAAYADLLSRPVKSITAMLVGDFKQVDLFTPAITDMDCSPGDASLAPPLIGVDPVHALARIQAAVIQAARVSLTAGYARAD